MSRSTKKHLYGSYYGCESDREYKQRAHREERRKVRQILNTDPTVELLPHCKEFGDGEDFGKGRKVFVPGLHWEMSIKEMIRWIRK